MGVIRTPLAVRTWNLWCLPRRAVAYILAVEAVALVALVVAARQAPVRAHDLVTFGLLLLCAAISVEGSRHLGSPATRRDRPYKDLLSAWMLPVALLLPPVYAMVVPVPVYLLVQARVTRIAPVKRAFNAAGVGLAGYLAALVHSRLAGRPALDPEGLLGSTRLVLAVVLAALVFAAVSAVLVAGVLRRVTPGMTLRAAFGDASLRSTEGGELCIGILVAMACSLSPPLVLLAVLPVLLLQRTLLHAELLEASRTDSKTGLANPRHWREMAEREVTRARSGGQPLAVLVVDLDRFKDVNDTHGHLAGDRVLVAVAEELQVAVRPRDLVGRFGGEEFVLLLADAPDSVAVRTAERVRERVQRMRPPFLGGSVTISVGVALLGEDGLDLESLLASADTALYAAKSAGRNCVRGRPPLEVPALSD